MKKELLKLADNSTYSNLGNPELKRVVFKPTGGFAARGLVEFYNDYFNLGKPESFNCYPCVRRALEALRKIFTDEIEPKFEEEQAKT